MVKPAFDRKVTYKYGDKMATPRRHAEALEAPRLFSSGGPVLRLRRHRGPVHAHRVAPGSVEKHGRSWQVLETSTLICLYLQYLSLYCNTVINIRHIPSISIQFYTYII